MREVHIPSRQHMSYPGKMPQVKLYLRVTDPDTQLQRPTRCESVG